MQPVYFIKGDKSRYGTLSRAGLSFEMFALFFVALFYFYFIPTDRRDGA